MTDRKYTTQARLEKYLNTTIEADCDVAPFILAAQDFIEKSTGHLFAASDTATARLFDGTNSKKLVIDPCVEVTKVEVGTDFWGDSFVEVTNTPLKRYFLLPYNYAEQEVPIDSIGLRDMYWVQGSANHRITARWGYSATPPEDIIFAATVIASSMYYQNRGGNTGPVESEKIGEYQVTYGSSIGVISDKNISSDSFQVTAILDRYKRYFL